MLENLIYKAGELFIDQYYYMITSMQHKMLPSESLVLQTKVEKKFLHRKGISEGEHTALDELIK